MTHPLSVAGNTLGAAAVAVVVLTLGETIGYTAGFIALALIVFCKIGVNILRNAVMVPG